MPNNSSVLRNFEGRLCRLLHLPPPSSGLRRLAFWFGLFALALFALSMLPAGIGARFAAARTLAVLFFAIFGGIVAIGWLIDLLRNKLLWRLSNRLVVTYFLVGFAPVFLFLVLAGLAGYVFAGQFAIYAVSSELDNRLNQLGVENSSLTHHLVDLDPVNPGAKIDPRERKAEESAEQAPGAAISITRDGKDLPLPGITTHPLAVPSWVPSHFLGFVLDNGHVFMRAVDREAHSGHTLVAASTLPLDGTLLTEVTRGLGETTLLPLRPGVIYSENEINVDTGANAPGVHGGQTPNGAGFYDIPVSFVGSTPYTNWQNGEKMAFGMNVSSRPTTLYNHLVSYSPAVSGIFRVLLIIVAVLFAILELIALIMAVRLNRTITGSVSALYRATQQIDRGNLSHRILVTRNDQLAELGKAFNTMTASLARLMVEQKEKERLQNELSIAQEVQANLFPAGNISLPMLELHGICKPAQSVSGDYYDFLLFGDDRLGIALGDISGKGISAALLMATLHSAVRAYRIAGEEIISAGNAGLMVPERLDRLWLENPQLAKDLVQLFDSPARILLLLNKHLYRSTQMEKYATLFLAHYDGRDTTLTYSNGGQLPPLVFSLDGSIKRLDCGGPVIGLLSDVDYEQGKVKLDRGDIFIAYSDGVTEPENDFGDFGEGRLVDIVRRGKHLPLPEISNNVMQALSAWIGAEEQPDDITLVLARQL